MDAGSCSSQLSAHEQQMPVARNWHNFTAGEDKMWTCGAGTTADHSKSNLCARLFQSPAGNTDVPINSIVMALFLLKALLIFRGPLAY